MRVPRRLSTNLALTHRPLAGESPTENTFASGDKVGERRFLEWAAGGRRQGSATQAGKNGWPSARAGSWKDGVMNLAAGEAVRRKSPSGTGRRGVDSEGCGGGEEAGLGGWLCGFVV